MAHVVVDFVFASCAILARRSCAFINVDFAVLAFVPGKAQTLVISDKVFTLPTIHTGIRIALVDVVVTNGPVVAGITSALKRIEPVFARSVISARVVVTFVRVNLTIPAGKARFADTLVIINQINTVKRFVKARVGVTLVNLVVAESAIIARVTGAYKAIGFVSTHAVITTWLRGALIDFFTDLAVSLKSRKTGTLETSGRILAACVKGAVICFLFAFVNVLVAHDTIVSFIALADKASSGFFHADSFVTGIRNALVSCDAVLLVV